MRSAIALILTLSSVGLVAQQRATFKSAVDLVYFGVSVVDKQGQPVNGLKPEDFEVTENGKKQSLQFFTVGDPEAAPPLHLGMLLDTSGSMADDLKDARAAAVKFVNALDHAADVTLVDFDTQVRVARFGPNEYERLVERIRGRNPDGWTALYDALGVYLNGAQNQDGQKVLVLYTDGGDNTSSLTFSEALDLLKASDVTVYAVGYLQHESSSTMMRMRGDLQHFAEMTGGEAYFPTASKDLDGVFDKIGKEIAARYSLGYVSSDQRFDGTWRNVQIKLLRKDIKGVKLRTRAGYFAPFKEGR
jgi:Ca-activated chloride channel homolog